MMNMVVTYNKLYFYNENTILASISLIRDGRIIDHLFLKLIDKGLRLLL